ncbi:hypothetical protein DXT63_15845 [Thermoanaerobacteraceae bacterium SP2]|nr:hypothetical protein DXT63_15845 [Thermoanaerobacteraceae bacterium SP2]
MVYDDKGSLNTEILISAVITTHTFFDAKRFLLDINQGKTDYKINFFSYMSLMFGKPAYAKILR